MHLDLHIMFCDSEQEKEKDMFEKLDPKEADKQLQKLRNNFIKGDKSMPMDEVQDIFKQMAALTDAKDGKEEDPDNTPMDEKTEPGSEAKELFEKKKNDKEQYSKS